MRILGLDYGSKTVGVAVSDPLGITAQGVSTIWPQAGEQASADILPRSGNLWRITRWNGLYLDILRT